MKTIICDLCKKYIKKDEKQYPYYIAVSKKDKNEACHYGTLCEKCKDELIKFYKELKYDG